MNVFISFSGKDREIKNLVVERLRQGLDAGDKVWESDEDCVGDFSEECIRQIDVSQVYVILLSAASMDTASYVFNELIRARQHEMRGETDLLIFQLDDVPLTPRFAMQLNHISDANHTGRLYHNIETGLNGLVNKVKYLLTCRKMGHPEKPFDVFEPELNGVPPGGGYYVPHSRDAVLEETDAALKKSNIVFSFQITGYGRRTAAHKYAEWKKDQYDHIFFFPQFAGSVRDFFLNGLVIKNINESVFERMTESEVILRKVDLLKKLGPRTLLAVPNVTLGPEDNAELFELLAGLTCRIIFVIHIIPRQLRDYYPIVNVGRMDDEYLLALFFHYYELGRAAERRALEEPLREFFRSVGGHTKTVEITSRVLMDEYVMPEEVPDILKRIGAFESDEIGDQVFRSVSGLFDLKKFDETDRNILLCAALMADIPVPEEEFIGVLRSAGAFSGRKLNRLIEMGWIDRDQDNRTLSMNAILSSVCIAKIPRDEAVLAACFETIVSDFFLSGAQNDRTQMLRRLRNLQRLWRILGMPGSAELAGKYLYVAGSDGDIRISPEETDALEEAALEETEGLPECVREDCGFIATCLVRGLRVGCALDALTDRNRDVALEDAFCSTVYSPLVTGMLAEIQSDETVSPLLSDVMGRFVACRSIREMVQQFLITAEQVIRWNKTRPGDGVTEAAMIVNLLGSQMSSLLRGMPYVRLQVLRSREELTEAFPELSSEADFFTLRRDKMQALIEMDGDEDEIEQAYREALEVLGEEGGRVFDDEQELEAALFELHQSYMSAMIEAERPDQAEEACRACWEIPVRSAVMLRDQVEGVVSVSNAMLAEGDEEEALSFMEEGLLRVRGMISARFLQEQEGQEARMTLEAMDELLENLRNPEAADDFSASEKEYESYDGIYGIEPLDPKRARDYLSAADRALRLDYTGYGDGELKTLREELARRAGGGEKWTALAPEAFALFSEASRRVLGYPLHHSQLAGAAAIFDGKAAEMPNGEGKTCSIAAAAFLHVLYGRRVHVLDLSAYLNRRNFVWMRSLLEYLGCATGILEKSGGIREETLKALSEADVIYARVYEMAFIAMRRELGEELLCRYPLRCDAAIADEGDQIFIPEHETMQITSGNKRENDKPFYRLAYDVISGLDPRSDRCFVCKDQAVTLKPPLFEEVEARLGKPLASLTFRETQTLDAALKKAVRALHFMQKDRDYFLVTADGGPRVMMENSMGELVPLDNYWSYLLWMKEGREDCCRLLALGRSRVNSEWSLFAYLKTYDHLSGASATFSSLRRELWEKFRLQVFAVAPNAPVIREDEPALVFVRKANKYRAIVDMIADRHEAGQPVLTVCQNIAESRYLSGLLSGAGVEHTLFNAVNADDDPDCLLYAGEPGRVTVTTPLANRGVDIVLGGNPRAYAKADLLAEGVSPEELETAVSGMGGDDPAMEDLRRRYAALCASKLRLFAPRKEEVERLGGLCVIGTTCFDDLRTERQVRGRAGRQGSPGESHIYYSMEDEPLRQLLGDRYQLVLQMMPDEDADEGIALPSLNRIIYNARLKLQYLAFTPPEEMRDVMYYDQARRIILGPIAGMRESENGVRGFIRERFSRDARYKADWEAAKGGQVRPRSLIALLSPDRLPERFDPEILLDRCLQLLEETGPAGGALIPDIVRETMIRALGEAWSAYLTAMEDEISHSGRLLLQEGRRKAYLTEFSAATAQGLLEDAAESALLTVYRGLSAAAAKG